VTGGNARKRLRSQNGSRVRNTFKNSVHEEIEDSYFNTLAPPAGCPPPRPQSPIPSLALPPASNSWNFFAAATIRGFVVQQYIFSGISCPSFKTLKPIGQSCSGLPSILALEAQQSRKFTPDERREIFARWYTEASPFVRSKLSKEDYLFEFLKACHRAKYPLGSKVIPHAWKLAQEQQPPPEAMQFEDPKKRLLVALCYHLQSLAGKEPFYLSARVCQRLLGQESHTTAASWLQVFCALEIIREVEKGKMGRASRYRYLHS
jgi:hypothetical protein